MKIAYFIYLYIIDVICSSILVQRQFEVIRKKNVLNPWGEIFLNLGHQNSKNKYDNL